METSTLFLGTIALATLVMAVVQVGMIVYGVRLVQRVHHLVDEVEKEIKPALIRVNEISGDMNRATSLAVAQLERVDELLGQFAGRADNLMTLAQDAGYARRVGCIARRSWWGIVRVCRVCWGRRRSFIYRLEALNCF